MFNVVTIAREYGSGGAGVGRKIAELLGWEFLDKQIIERAAVAGRVRCDWIEAADEKSRSWWEDALHGLNISLELSPDSSLDYDTVQVATARVIQEAARVGNCVIIGRSSQCVLRHHPHVLHALVYAPLAEKMERMKLRHPHERDLRALLQRMDSDRSHYTQNYFGCDWLDRRLYHLCVNSTLGLDACAELIVRSLKLKIFQNG
jgi:cytidylate kinase